ncbi:MAG: class I SAM-dependent methyltransferase [Candidatus Methanomethylicaceae archaeon]
MDVADIFNATANEYDEILDLWYAWLFSRLHFIIARDVIKAYAPKSILDVGCGTGFQSFLHAAGGAKTVIGIDIAEDLVKVACKKSSNFNPRSGFALFPAHFKFVNKYNHLIERTIITEGNPVHTFSSPVFAVADARELPFPDGTFDHVNCCGSTLSLIDNHCQALAEISRVLRPGGTFLFEVEARWGADVFWMLIDCLLLRGKLGFHTSIKESLKALTAPISEYVYIDYPFVVAGELTFLRLKLFTEKGIRRELSNLGFRVIKKYSIHSMTNILPGTWLAMANPPKMLRLLFTILASIEENFPFYLPGSSIVFLAQKENLCAT